MSRKTRAAGEDKRISVEKGERVYVGVDVHKRSYHVALWSQDRGRIVRVWSQPSQGQALADRLDPIRSAVVRVFYEAGPTGFGLARELRERG